MDRIWQFNVDRDIQLADRVEATIRARAEQLIDFPALGRPNPDLGIRELSLTDIQYRVGYTVRDDTILITSVRSTREAA